MTKEQVMASIVLKNGEEIPYYDTSSKVLASIVKEHREADYPSFIFDGREVIVKDVQGIYDHSSNETLNV